MSIGNRAKLSGSAGGPSYDLRHLRHLAPPPFPGCRRLPFAPLRHLRHHLYRWSAVVVAQIRGSAGVRSVTVQRSTSSPSSLTLVRALRADRPTLTGPQIDDRLIEIEQSLQRRLSVAEAAKLTGEKPGTVYQAIARGHLPASREGASNVHRLTVDDVQTWAQRPKRCSDQAA